MNIINLYKEQQDIFDTPKYKNYIDNLKLYYDKTELSSKYDKEIDENNNLKLIEKKNKANVIIIKRTNITNIYSYYNKILDDINNIYNSISELIKDTEKSETEKKNRFNELKEKYKLINKNKKDIDSIFTEQDNILFKLKEEKLNFSIELTKIFFERKDLYKDLELINNNKKNLILNEYKKNMKIPDENDINKLSSKINIQSSEILKWLKWIDKSYIYINYQIKINKLEDSIKINIKNNKLINENFIIEKPMFNEKNR